MVVLKEDTTLVSVREEGAGLHGDQNQKQRKIPASCVFIMMANHLLQLAPASSTSHHHRTRGAPVELGTCYYGM